MPGTSKGREFCYRALPEFILMPAMFGSESSRNAHDVRRALSHYADDVEMSSL